ncbi:MAG: tetratricopeptide repeat protein, partial [Planctomycetota bacterium]|nr:tetratricopeptide repeat protein [Planctomycetota bacterium]
GLGTALAYFASFTIIAASVIALTQDNLKEAREHFLHILKKGENAIARFNLGTLLYREKKEDEALKEFQKAIELDPRLQRAYLAIADILGKGNKKDEAREQLRRALEVDPDSAEAERARQMLRGLQ